MIAPRRSADPGDNCAVSMNQSASVRKVMQGESMPSRLSRALKRAAIAGVATLALSACTTLNVDGALSDVNALVEDRTSKTVSFQQDQESRLQADYAVRQLFTRPLTIDTATQIAFLRHASNHASLVKLGIAEADVAQAGRMRNPVISIGRIAGGGVLEIERQFLSVVI